MRVLPLLYGLCIFTCSASFGGVLNLSTGLDSAGNVITTDHGCDAHWVQVTGPSLACAGGGTTGAAEVVLPTDPDWFGGWLANDTNSAWISSDVTTTQNGSPAPTYSITFYLSSTVGASLSGLWSSDDGSIVKLNSATLGTQGGCCIYNGSVSDSTAGDFLVGANTLSITIQNSDNFLEGVRFNGSVTGQGAAFAPEPGSVVLMLMGAGAIVLRRRRHSSR
jgi:hypothetical protein